MRLENKREGLLYFGAGQQTATAIHSFAKGLVSEKIKTGNRFVDFLLALNVYAAKEDVAVKSRRFVVLKQSYSWGHLGCRRKFRTVVFV